MSAREFQVKFKANGGALVKFPITDAMMKFLVHLESEDTSDLEFIVNDQAVSLRDLIENKCESNTITEICKFIEYISGFMQHPISSDYQFDPEKIWASPTVAAREIGIVYGYPEVIGNPRPNQQNARWVKFKVTNSKFIMNLGVNIPDPIWIKQLVVAPFDFSIWIHKWMRIVGIVREKWMINVFEVITDNKIAYRAGGL
jgi:hypothetical protein